MTTLELLIQVKNQLEHQPDLCRAALTAIFASMKHPETRDPHAPSTDPQMNQVQTAKLAVQFDRRAKVTGIKLLRTAFQHDLRTSKNLWEIGSFLSGYDRAGRTDEERKEHEERIYNEARN